MTATIAKDSASLQRLKVLTWNVNSAEIDDGTPMRLEAVLREIETCDADVIFLQEVTMIFKKMLELRLSCTYDFEDLSAATTEDFFVMTMLRKCRMKKLTSERVDFQDSGRSSMGRFILKMETRCLETNTSMTLMTAHLESCKPNSDTRMHQYEQLLRLMALAPANSVQLCCGDFNLREAEDKAVRKRFKGSSVYGDIAVDAFDAAGRPFDASSTWRRKMDLAPSARSAQARFDRQMFRSGCNDFLLVQDSFRLLGLEDVVGIDERVVCSAGFATPSDHFGILCEYAFGAAPSAVVSYEANNLVKAAGKAISVKTPVVLVLIGAPGSGKSTLASLLCPGFVRISQDELGNRAKCMDAADAALQSGISIIVDRCNFDAQQRSTWLSLAERCSARTVAVQLDVPLVVCIQRVAARKGHEGGVDGNSQATIDIVTKLHGDQKCVTDDEGFHHVHVFRHTSTPESIAAELRWQYSSHETSCRRGSTSLPSYSAARLRQVSSALHPIGVQSDSSSESSQERAVLQFSECVAPPASALSEHLAPCHPPAASGSADKADASNDECVLVEHVPPRSKRPLPGLLASAMQPVKVKSDPDVAVIEGSSVVQAPPAKKGRGRIVKTPGPAVAPCVANQPQQQAAEPSPLPLQETVHFRFTAETLLKAATLYLATHPFLESQTSLHVSGQQSQQASQPNEQICRPSSFSTYSQFTSQPSAQEFAVQSQQNLHPASLAYSTQSMAPQSQRFDIESAFLETAPLLSFSATRSSSSIRSEHSQSGMPAQSLLSKGKSGSHDFDDCSDITSDDFEKNFMSSLLPRPRSQVAQVAAASHPPVAARDSSAVAGARWNSQFSGTSLKDIADMLCTSTRRN